MSPLKLLTICVIIGGTNFVADGLEPTMSKNGTVFVVLLARNKEVILPYFLTYFERLSYPKKEMILHIRADHCQDQTIAILRHWLSLNKEMYRHVESHLDESSSLYETETSPNDHTDEWYNAVIGYKETALNTARRMQVDYTLFLDMDVILTDENVIQNMINETKAIVAPMLLSEGLMSNFWGAMTEDYWFKNSDYHDKIRNESVSGCFPVPLVHSFVLIDMKELLSLKLTFVPPKIDVFPPFDDSMAFAHSVSFETHICNRRRYGYVLPPLDPEDDADIMIEQLHELKMRILDRHGPLTVSEALSGYTDSTGAEAKRLRYIAQTYYINLERRPDRLERMTHILNALRLPAKRVVGVDGRAMSSELIEEAGLRVLEEFVDPLISGGTTIGNIGCLISHYVIWKEVIEKDYKQVMVLEDDIRLETGFRYKLESFLARLMDSKLEWDLIYLGRKPFSSKNLDLEKEVEELPELLVPSYSYWTVGYLLSRTGAEKLVDADPLSKMIPVDEFLPIMYDKSYLKSLFKYFPVRDLRAFALYPTIVQPQFFRKDELYVSDTNPWNGTEGAAASNPCLDHLLHLRSHRHADYNYSLGCMV